MSDRKQLEYLDEIKRYIEDEEMSFLIGAGFSRNVNKDAYPMWGELLRDATWNLFGFGDRTKNEKKVIDKAVKDHGYLGIASMMVQKAGFHEAIDTYIEERTPYLKTENGKPELYLNGDPLHIIVNSDCHILLKKLDIQNIYTFNYDNALEFFLGEEARLEAESVILRLDKEATDLRKQAEKLALKENDLNEQLKYLEQQELESPAESPVTSEKDDSRGRDEIQKDINDIKSQRRKIRQQERETHARIEMLKINRTSYYNVVKDSYEISLSAKRKSIYKIHGSLRENDDKEYGFDGDSHKQYIITQEDYDTYNDKHSAFVSMMRIDLLRSRFCIIGVSGGDANFLAWINWVKDVLDKTKARSKDNDSEPHKSYFIYSSSKSMPREMVLMLRNHFIQPVILKEAFSSAANDEERIKLFLEYIQPLKNETSRLSDLWGKIEFPRSSNKAIKPIEVNVALELFELSSKNRFNRPNGAANYMAIEVQVEGKKYVGEGSDLASRMVYASALMCSMMPIDLFCDEKLEQVLRKEKEKKVKDVYLSAIRRAGLLLNSSGLTKTLIGEDNYTKIVKGLFNLHFPTADEIKEIDGKDGLAIVRRLSLYNLIRHGEEVEEKCSYNVFKSPQELVLAADWLKFIDYNDPELFKKADEYRQEEKLLSFYEYIQAFLKAMRRKEEVSSYGNISNTIYLDRYSPDVTNAAILMNSFVELGVCFAGNQVFADSEWLQIVRALKKRYPAAMVFYTLVRDSNHKVIKTVAQELMYDELTRSILPSILKNLITSLVSDNTPIYVKGKISLFASNILCAVGVRNWQRLFRDSVKKIVECADKLSVGLDIPKQMYEFVSNALNYINDKEIKIWCLDHILDRQQINEYFEGHLNVLAISARKGLSTVDFMPLVPKYHSFAKKAIKSNNQQGCFVVINLVGLIERSQRSEYLKMLESRALKDAYMIEGYAARIKSYPELKDSFKKKLLSKNDLWHSGIMENGVSFGLGNVSVCKIDRLLVFDDIQVDLAYRDLMNTVGKIEAVFKKENHQKEDKGWMSSENNFREMVLDMRLFVNAHKTLLSKSQFFGVDMMQLDSVYYQCFFGKTIYQLIADDQMYRAIRRLMVEAEINGIENYRLEYEQIIGKIISKDSSELGTCFQHIVWSISHRQKFFNTEDFKKLFKAILEVYRPFFENRGDGASEWNLLGCQKEIAEKSLLLMHNTLEEWGVKNRFWEQYKRKFQIR